MTTLGPTRDLWHPVTESDRELVRAELAEILVSPQFTSSKRYPTLLSFVVESALSGHAELLKERTLGVHVFQRRADYDTNADTVVRFTAGEVRKRLQMFYHEHPARPVYILLPVGSYVPEFLRSEAEVDTLEFVPEVPPPATLPLTQPSAPAVRRSRAPLVFALCLLVVAAIACPLWYHGAHKVSALDQFWAPLLASKNPALLCSGAVVFAPNFSGTTTADRDTEYPFVSMQSVASIVRLSGVLERRGTPYDVSASTSTSLPELRERPLILVGGYNNPWTLLLTAPLRFHFMPSPNNSIVDRQNPGVFWKRDKSIPYSTSDDYALVARFYDSSTDSPVLVLAGVGRNATEGATQFVTSPHYMEQLRDKLGGNFGNRNIEVVLKTRVIDAKTGAPSIEAVYTWK